MSTLVEARSEPTSLGAASSIKEQIPLERVLTRVQATAIALVVMRLLTAVRPHNAYHSAIVEEYVENQKFERDRGIQTVSRSGVTGTPTVPSPSQAQRRRGDQRNNNIINLMKLLIIAKLDMLKRVHAVLSHDNETLDRLAVEQQKQMDRLRRMVEDFGVRLGHMEKLLQLRTVQLLELRDRVNTVQFVSLDGTFAWAIDNIAKRKNDAITGRQMSLYSPAFYVHRYGYKICLRLYLNGDGLGKSTHMSLFVVVMRSPWDNLLRWPFQQKITLLLYDQNFKAHIIDAFRPDNQNPSFKKPENMMNIASGSSLFVPLCMLNPEENKENAYIKDDRMFIKVIVDCSDLPSLEHIR